MPKDAERNYFDNIGEEGRIHSLNKPFSDQTCPTCLSSMGIIMSLLPAPPAKIVDFGCGAGWTSVFLARFNFLVTAQDISPAALALARENAAHNGVTDRIEFIEADFETLALEPEYSAALFYDCLHHAEDERAALQRAYDALKPGGICLTHEPGEGHATAPWSIVAMEQFGVTEKDMPPELIIRHAREIGFSSWRVYPMPDTIKPFFYGEPAPKLLSREGLAWAKRLINLAANPSHKAGAIVKLIK